MADNNEDILIVDDCGCDCHCNDVELRSEHQPDVLLFDEYAEAYENDIVHIRETVDEIKEVEEGLATEANATANKNEVIAKIEDTAIDPTPLAKEATSQQILTQATNAAADAAAAKTAAQSITGYAKETNATANRNQVINHINAAQVAIKGDDSSATLSAIKSAVANTATESNATSNKNAIINAINATKAALQGNNTAATLSAILQAVIEGGGGGGTGDAKESTSQEILATLPQFRVENNDTLVIYTGANESEKIVPVFSTGVYRMKWSQEIEANLDLETLLGQFLSDLMDDELEEMIEGKEMSSCPISIQVMNKDIATELYYIALDNAEPYYEWETIADIVDQGWDGETYIYIQFRFHDFPFTENSGYSFDDFMYEYYWRLSYPIYLDEYGILSYTDESRPIVDIIEIESSDESN